jgi:polysaccharide export outer membrane protein
MILPATSARLRAAALMAMVITLIAGGHVAGQLPPSTSPQAADYTLGPDDVLEVTVWGYPDLTRVVAVRPDGKISLPLVGPVTASEVTVERLTAILIRAYSAYIVNPHVTVIVKEFRRIRVSVLGQVARAGAYALPPGALLLDLLAAAGGVTEAAALKEARLLRPGRPPTVIDLERLLAGDATLNVPLRGGETLVIPEDLVNIVNVVGEVVKPGRYRLKGEMRVLEVLLLAGGLTDKASVTQARLVRDGAAATPLHLDRLLLRQEMTRNVVLQPGDTLIIPEETNNRIYILGDVHSPGVHVLRGEVSLLQAIAMAGGPVQRGPATARNAHIVRRNGTGTELLASAGARVDPLPNGGVVIAVDLQSLIRGGEVRRDVVVQPGDVIVVSQSGLSSLAMFLNILSGLLILRF